ncbi:uncharacterized protein LOC113798982 [Dermatophagoides pteronyssinus]|uniref:uncharacterized protein LOC113798982 n=1 Tax=Dermatophagoides pteronyssinus TaxID=6956 RepID=UPI003F66A636
MSNVRQKKKNQPKYQKPTQPIYRPPSARIESSMSGPNLSSSSSFIPTSLQAGGNHPSDIFLIKQPSTSFGNVVSNVFPIRGVLKRSKSFGNNNNNNNRSKDNPETINKQKYHFLNASMADAFFLTIESISKENLNIIKRTLNRQTCTSVTMTQLLQIIRVLCNKVLDKSNNANIVAKVCLEIHYNQQMNMIHLSDHKYLFLESLANCLREWFNERDKLRFTTGGARRWTNYITFLKEIYLNLKETIVKDYETNKFYFSDSNDDDYDDDEDDDDEDVNEQISYDENVVDHVDDNADDNDDVDDDDFDDFSNSQSINNNNNNNNETSSANDSSQADSSSCKSGSSERSMKKTSSTNSIEIKIMNSLLCKQQKQFANLLLDSFQVILSNPNSTPAEIECMQCVFRQCGKYLDEDNPSRIKTIIFLIRDILLNCSNLNQFINSQNNTSLNSSINKNLLEIIELYSSGWQFDQSQQIYYFPYTKID